MQPYELFRTFLSPGVFVFMDQRWLAFGQTNSLLTPERCQQGDDESECVMIKAVHVLPPGLCFGRQTWSSRFGAPAPIASNSWLWILFLWLFHGRGPDAEQDDPEEKRAPSERPS
jgi:hypothetical protein